MTLCSTFFLEMEMVELDIFGRKFSGLGGVELFLVLRSSPRHALNETISFGSLGFCIALVHFYCIPSSPVGSI